MSSMVGTVQVDGTQSSCATYSLLLVQTTILCKYALKFVTRVTMSSHLDTLL